MRSYFDVRIPWESQRQPLAWTDDAACQGLSDYVFYTPSLYSEALSLCRICPVVADCRALADRAEGTFTEVYGVFGGETPQGRVRRRRREAHKDEEAA